MYESEIAEKQAEYDALPKRPLEVRMHMAGPFSNIDYVRLDGIMAYFSLREIMGGDLYNLTDYGPAMQAPLPLEKCNKDGNGKWWWACSYGVFELSSETISSWKKRWEEKYEHRIKAPEGRVFRISHKYGHYKAYDMPIVLKNARQIAFYCLGNADEIKRLLKPLRFIGKKRSQGYGRVSWIEVLDTKNEIWNYDEAGKPMRHIPMIHDDIGKLLEDHANIKMTRTGYRPPYWHRDSIAWCQSVEGSRLR